MRVLLLSDLYSPLIGGLERHVEALGLELRRRGHDVSIATMYQPGTEPEESSDGLRVHRLRGWSSTGGLGKDPARRFHPPFPDPGAVARLEKVYEREAPHVVHAHNWMLFSALRANRRPGRAAAVVTLHDYGLVCPKRTYLHDGRACSGPALAKCMRSSSTQYGWPKALPLTIGLRASWRLLSGVDRFIAVSHAVASTAAPAIGDRPLDVIPTFIGDEVLQADPASVSPQGRGAIVFVGALGTHKGWQVLLRAWRGLSEPKPKLILIGTRMPASPAEWPAGVEVREHVAHGEVMVALREARVVVVPSLWPEPCPTVALEAMAAGAPLIASSVGGIPEIVIDNETGLLVPPGDEEALRTALRRLLDDDELWLRMRARALTEAPRFAASAVVPRVEAVYSAALQSLSA